MAERAEIVLIVDDETDVAHVIDVTLASEGFVTYIAADGEQAVKMAEELRPDLVLLDVMMPGLDGVEVCRRLRSNPATAAISIIMLTAKTLPSDRVVGLTAGADDYVAKPFDVDELVARVRSTLRRSAQLRGISPLTGLPGNFEIVREIDSLLDEGADFAVMHLDLDDFKAYNDYYGFVRGDDVIRLTAEVLTDVAADIPGQSFLGHVGGDDFVMVCNADAATAVADAAMAAFDARIPEAYDPEDQLNGYIEVEDRMGMAHRYPFVALSIGISSTGIRKFDSATELAAIASEMKMLAKRDPGSSWRMDRRQE
jgi:diguanylate cyclase (GGDEF)-like protein